MPAMSFTGTAWDRIKIAAGDDIAGMRTWVYKQISPWMADFNPGGVT